jgi:hypothetical protein
MTPYARIGGEPERAEVADETRNSKDEDLECHVCEEQDPKAETQYERGVRARACAAEQYQRPALRADSMNLDRHGFGFLSDSLSRFPFKVSFNVSLSSTKLLDARQLTKTASPRLRTIGISMKKNLRRADVGN